jgi:sugar lactone lactonase YvrE
VTDGRRRARAPANRRRWCAAVAAFAAAWAFAVVAGTRVAQAAGSATWTNVTPASMPSARFNGGVAYDAATKQVVLFGGSDALGDALGETWIWNGLSWAQRTPATSPSPRFGASMAYDAGSRQLLLFGGSGDTGTRSNETWTWTGSNWVQLHPASSPPAESSPAMAYDTAVGKILIFGGFQGASGSPSTVSNATWAWNGANWAKLAPATVPDERAGAAIGYDAATRQLVMYGGADSSGDFSDTWVWNGSNWIRHNASTPGPLSEMSLAYDAATNQLLMVAGQGSGSPAGAPMWSWNGSAWTQLIPATSLPPRVLQYATYDAANGELLAFGGTLNGIYLDDTWLYGPLEIPPQALPPATVGARYSASLSAIAGTPPDTWSIVSAALPAGLSLSPAGIISGTPTTAGTVSFTVAAIDAEAPAAQARRTVSLKVNPPPKAAVWVTDVGDDLIHSFALSASGNAAPSTTIGGSLTAINIAGGIVIDPTGAVDVSNVATPSIVTFAPGASGNVAPVRTIAGPATGLAQPAGLALDSGGLLYAANQASNTITVYAAGAAGDAAPVRTISGADTELSQPAGVVVDGAGHLWVANASGNLLTEYAPGASGDAVPVGVFRGLSTGLNQPSAIAIDGSGRLLVANRLGQSVTAFTGQPPFGNTIPAFTISGGASQLSYPRGLDLDAAGNLYVANQFGGVNVYAPGAGVPTSVIAGAATGLASPGSLAVAPPLAIATASLPAAAVGRRYATRLAADLGTAPLHWRIGHGHLPRGLVLTPAGRIAGVPRRRGRFTITVTVTDSTRPAMHDSATLSVTVGRAPAVTGLAPAQGARAGGGTVTITGSGFATARGGTVVAFGRLRALSVHCRSRARCVVVPPPHAAGAVHVTVRVRGIRSRRTRRNRYRYTR